MRFIRNILERLGIMVFKWEIRSTYAPQQCSLRDIGKSQSSIQWFMTFITTTIFFTKCWIFRKAHLSSSTFSPKTFLQSVRQLKKDFGSRTHGIYCNTWHVIKKNISKKWDMSKVKMLLLILDSTSSPNIRKSACRKINLKTEKN